ncbi:Flp pilus assembly protein CpaB [Caenimonas sp. SL110]|uniref:Flp pilus assembly protein CpaB n=1 Tax=Caenimonas sp. SL110 TaxID=1450524 RepID=UPI0006528715|nr:Flp pilus assembly protein CpaB [Caenimonas sp. SL110]
MKNTRPLLVILVSVIVGAIAVAIAARWVAMQASVATAQVVVAARDLEVGTRLRPDMVQVVDWPAGAALKEPFDTVAKVQDRVLNTQVLRGEPIVATKLANPGEKGGLSAVLEQGTRAITVKVNEIVGVGGFALPGNYVDVMVNTPDDANRPVSKIVLERILVLAVAQDVSTGDSKPRVVNAVTLQVTPQQAEQIDLARSIGSLSLVLRSQLDKGSSATAGARKSDLLNGKSVVTAVVANAAPAAPAVAARPAVVAPRPVRKAVAVETPPKPAEDKLEVIRGLKKSVE